MIIASFIAPLFRLCSLTYFLKCVQDKETPRKDVFFYISCVLIVGTSFKSQVKMLINKLSSSPSAGSNFMRRWNSDEKFDIWRIFWGSVLVYMHTISTWTHKHTHPQNRHTGHFLPASSQPTWCCEEGNNPLTLWDHCSMSVYVYT